MVPSSLSTIGGKDLLGSLLSIVYGLVSGVCLQYLGKGHWFDFE